MYVTSYPCGSFLLFIGVRRGNTRIFKNQQGSFDEKTYLWNPYKAIYFSIAPSRLNRYRFIVPSHHRHRSVASSHHRFIVIASSLYRVIALDGAIVNYMALTGFHTYPLHNTYRCYYLYANVDFTVCL